MELGEGFLVISRLDYSWFCGVVKVVAALLYLLPDMLVFWQPAHEFLLVDRVQNWLGRDAPDWVRVVPLSEYILVSDHVALPNCRYWNEGWRESAAEFLYFVKYWAGGTSVLECLVVDIPCNPVILLPFCQFIVLLPDNFEVTLVDDVNSISGLSLLENVLAMQSRLVFEAMCDPAELP